jgi:hypothetical protein
MENHPYVPMLSLHRPVPMLPNTTLDYLRINPAGVAQRAFCMVPKLGRLQVSAGYSALLWDKDAQGTKLLEYHLPSVIADDKASTNLATKKGAPRMRFLASSVAAAPKLGAAGRSWMVTTYQRELPKEAKREGLLTLLVKEPVMPHRWAHAPTMLCCTLLEYKGNGSLLLVHLDDNHHGTCLLEYQQ